MLRVAVLCTCESAVTHGGLSRYQLLFNAPPLLTGASLITSLLPLSFSRLRLHLSAPYFLLPLLVRPLNLILVLLLREHFCRDSIPLSPRSRGFEEAGRCECVVKNVMKTETNFFFFLVADQSHELPHTARISLSLSLFAFLHLVRCLVCLRNVC